MKFPLVIGANGHVAAIDRKSGSEIWRTNIADGASDGAVGMRLVVVGDRVFIGANGHLLCLELQTGRKLWQNDLEGLGHDEIAFAAVISKPRIHWFAWVCWFGVLIWVCTVFWLSSRGGPELAEDFPFLMEAWDKFLHFIAFFCGVLPLVPALRLSTAWPWKKIYWIAVACISIYGALDEVHQHWTPSRSGLSVGDWIADTLGALAGAALSVFIHARIERRRTRPVPAGN